MDDYRRREDPFSLPPRGEKHGSLPSRKERHGSRSTRSKGGNKRRFFTKKWFFLVIITSLLLIVGGCSTVVMSAGTVDLEKMEDMKYASAIYDQEGKLIGRVGGNNREPITMEELKKHNPALVNAFVKVEDARFYKHNGVDYYALMRAVVKNIVKLGAAEGGGTITMQVARNAILEDRDKNIKRKLKEIGAALNLERKYSKDQILETYLNYIYFGNNVRGVKMAAKIYFNKDISKETLKPHEVALLAGLPKAPEGYNPFRNPEGAKNRRNTVLAIMARGKDEDGLDPIISKEEVSKYQQMDLGVKEEYLEAHLKNNEFEAYKAYVIDEAKRNYDLSDEELTDGGLKIYTALNPKAQKIVDEALKDDATYQGHDNLDGGATILKADTGEIVAIGGGRHYKPGSMIRSAEKKGHQPGSSIKPLTVYAPAMELNEDINEYSKIPDEKFSINGWTPQNYTRRYYGDVELSYVVENSLNASTAWLLHNKVKLPNAFNFAQKAGLKLHPEDQAYAAMALGGLTEGASTVEMAQAYTVFPNNGKAMRAHAIRKIEQADGTEVAMTEEAQEALQPVEVFKPKTAYYMTRMLKKVVEKGTGTKARLKDGRPVAGKTGTTQEYKDSWFVGYTPDYVMAATIYNLSGDKDKRVQLSGGSTAAPLFSKVMSEFLAGTPARDFEKPPGVEEPKPPFELKPVTDLKGSFNREAGVIQLRWTDYDDRVKYRVERSEDGANWRPLGETAEGAFTDNQIEVPQPGDPLSGIFGGRTYHYRVIAIDTETNEEAQPSNVVSVQVKPRQEPPGDQQGDQPGDPQGDQGHDRGPGGFLGGDQGGRDGGDRRGDPPNPPGGDQQGDQGGGDQGGRDTGWPW
ncbi:transglycosylase domain-containing protein [Planifilum fimeticola]